MLFFFFFVIKTMMYLVNSQESMLSGVRALPAFFVSILVQCLGQSRCSAETSFMKK